MESRLKLSFREAIVASSIADRGSFQGKAGNYVHHKNSQLTEAGLGIILSNNNAPSIPMFYVVFVLQEHLELKLFANRPCHRAAAIQVNVTI